MSRNFFANMDREQALKILGQALYKCDDGELFLETRQSESIVWEDGRVKSSNFDNNQGFGLRAVCGESTAYSHSCNIDLLTLGKAASSVAAIKGGHQGSLAIAPIPGERKFYGGENPLGSPSFSDKVKLLEEIDLFARKAEPKISQVIVSLTGAWQNVGILRPDGFWAQDTRPMVRFNVTVIVTDKGKRETGSYGFGGRHGYDIIFAGWQKAVKEAIDQALINLEAINAPAGEMEVVLGSGWPGILLHEAIGHGLEGDFNRKKTSAFSGLVGQKIAAPGVTVADNGTINLRRGSLNIDDEGTPSQNTILIEDGILKGYMQDRLNAKLMGQDSTGNGRRQDYAHTPLPRMTNTCMMAGDKSPEEIIASVKNGVYAVNFSGGQVDITSGKFVFSASLAYKIEKGKIGPAIKGATLIGNGPDVLTRVSMIGNDFAMDAGVGVCGKDGQGVPVGVGQPTLKLSHLTVGGTEKE